MQVATTLDPALLDSSKGGAPKRKKKAVPNGVLGMIVFVIAETMFFTGMISAFIIIKSKAQGGVWPPLGQPRLPIESTAVNTAILLLSGLALGIARSRFKKAATADERKKAQIPLVISFLLGLFFLAFQGSEWVQLIKAGLTFTVSSHGSFFYFIVGTHGLHVLAAILGLFYCLFKFKKGTLHDDELWTAQIFYYFVVGMWPILYWQVYLP